MEELGESSEAEKSRKKMLQPFKRYRLLVVDDMKTNLEALRGILENLYDVVLVKSGRQALLYLDKNERPDLVLMDIDMPEMDEDSVLFVLRQHFPDGEKSALKAFAGLLLQ